MTCLPDHCQKTTVEARPVGGDSTRKRLLDSKEIGNLQARWVLRNIVQNLNSPR